MQTDLNSFETDMLRAVWSWRFLVGLAAEFLILVISKMNTDLYYISVPIVCTLPYTTAVLDELQSGYIKSYLPRTSRTAYIYGKVCSCMISGGLIEVLPVLLYAGWKRAGVEGMLYLLWGGSRLDMNYPGDGGTLTVYYGLLFLSGALWAILSATLSTWTKSRYIAYGSSFVIYYLLVILQQRYFPDSYMMSPVEWFRYQYTWVFGQWGIVLMLTGIGGILCYIYIQIVRMWMERI